MSSGLYSGFAMHEAAQRYLKELRIAPKLTSSLKAEQYVSPSVIAQLRGLPNSSVVVRNSRCGLKEVPLWKEFFPLQCEGWEELPNGCSV